MSILLLLLLVAVIAVIAMVAVGRGGSLPEVEAERSPRGALPSGPLQHGSVDGLRFTLAFRGYRMDEVDDVLDRLAQEIEERDRRIAELEGRRMTPRADDTLDR